MHPATHRALRELAATAQLLDNRWTRLADRLRDDDPAAATPLKAGAQTAAELTEAISVIAAARDVPVRGTAAGLGVTLGTTMAVVGEPFLERNQALRTAVLDAHHATLLLHYVEHLARAEGDDELASAAGEWAHRLVVHEGEVRERAISLGDAPDLAVAPIDHSPVGQAAHQVASVLGGAGEWVDRRLGERGERGGRADAEEPRADA
jgi:hypothetical protein